MKTKTVYIAVCGVLTAVAVALMFFGSFIPVATFAVPALASLCVFYATAEFGRLWGVLLYISVALLGVFFAPDKEIALLFVGFFGHYPIFKSIFEKKLPVWLSWVCKLLLFNACVVGSYLLAIRVLGIEQLAEEFTSMKPWFVAVLLLLGNLVFVVFDIALTRLLITYTVRWRDRLLGGNKK